MHDVKIVERQRDEAQYHDKKTIDGIQLNSRNAQSACYLHFEKMIGNIHGLKVLDLGCGDGWYSINLVRMGGHVWGVDISNELLKLAYNQSEQLDLIEHPYFARMAAEQLAFCDDFFNLVIGSAILHHTNIELTIQSIHRVLKPGGQAIFIEPMNENILLRIWRKLTPWRRSPLEKALVTKDVLLIEQEFTFKEHSYFILTSIIAEALLILFPQSKLLNILDNLLARLDSFLLKRYPSLTKYCAVVVLVLRK